jgi:hypothetical protein
MHNAHRYTPSPTSLKASHTSFRRDRSGYRRRLLPPFLYKMLHNNRGCAEHFLLQLRLQMSNLSSPSSSSSSPDSSSSTSASGLAQAMTATSSPIHSTPATGSLPLYHSPSAAVVGLCLSLIWGRLVGIGGKGVCGIGAWTLVRVFWPIRPGDAGLSFGQNGTTSVIGDYHVCVLFRSN